MAEENTTAEAEDVTEVTETEEATAETPEPEEEIAVEPEEISYHAVEKDGDISAIWEMQGPKHLRTIDPRSREGQQILQLFTAEVQENGEAASA